MQTKLHFSLGFCLLLFVGFGSLGAQSDRPFSAGLTEVFPYQNYAGQQVYNLTRAQQFMRDGQWEQAIITLDFALAQQPDWIPALVGRANALALVGREAEARRDRERAIRLNQTAAQVLLSRGKQQPIRFLALYPEEWLREHGMEPGAVLRPGRPHAAIEGSFDYFAFQYDRIQATPDSCTVGRALRYKVAGDFQDADQLLLALRAANPALVPMLRANLLLASHDYIGAVALYNRALQESAVDWPELRYNRGLAYLLLNNYANGCADLYYGVDQGFMPAAKLYQSLCNF